MTECQRYEPKIDFVVMFRRLLHVALVIVVCVSSLLNFSRPSSCGVAYWCFARKVFNAELVYRFPLLGDHLVCLGSRRCCECESCECVVASWHIYMTPQRATLQEVSPELAGVFIWSC